MFTEKNIFLFFKWPRLRRITPRNTLCVNAALDVGLARHHHPLRQLLVVYLHAVIKNMLWHKWHHVFCLLARLSQYVLLVPVTPWIERGGSIFLWYFLLSFANGNQLTISLVYLLWIDYFLQHKLGTFSKHTYFWK